ncbi:terminase small subunit, partial [Massilia sp. 2TAF26]
AVLAGKSHKEAAIAAGYSAKTAGPAGSRLVKEPPVAAYIAACRAATKEYPVPAPPKPFDPTNPVLFSDPKAFLTAAMNDGELPEKLRVEAAKALMPFVHQRKGEGGKKEAKKDAAANVATGRFGAPPPPPRLVAGGKK